ncbi:MAG: Gfo/Idh/MocA family oxidoreductase [Terriglobia bacterium]
MQTRRNFIGKVATGLAGSLATGKVLAAGDRIRLGIIGAGERGTQLAREVVACPNTEIVAFADIYQRRVDDFRSLAPAAAPHTDYRQLLNDKSIDAVVIATPQHLHAECFVAALDAGKHVYIEKTMAFTVEEAKTMRAAHESAGKRIVQVGHQTCSSGHVADALNYLSGTGKVTAIRASMYRNAPHGKPQWSRPAYPDMTPESIAWKSFLGTAPERDFDANRYINWRLFRDYSGGGVFENMSQQTAFWYKTMDLRIPNAVHMTGGLYLWKDGREVPDTMSVTMEHPEEILFTWNSGFGNNYPGVTEEVLGTDGTIARGQQIRFLPQKVNRPEGVEMLGQTSTPPRAHVQNFLDCIRSGNEPNCPFEIGYRVSITCRMAIESYLLGRTIRWDSKREVLI